VTQATIQPDWSAPGRVHAVVSTRALGDMSGEGGGRERLRALAPDEPVWLRQTHGTAVADADAARPARAVPQADAAVARRARTVCAVLVADCMPVLLAHDAGSVVAVAHAGWRGLAAGVVEAAVAAMQVAPREVIAWLGPAIGARAYEVGPEVRAAFLARGAEAETAFAPGRAGRWLLDLYGVARQRLARCGVRRIYGGSYCTYSDAERFYSYRRDGTAARMAALIWLA
jgi:YfiH family protein